MLKSKTLPQDFEEILKSGDLTSLKAVFYKCAFDAIGGHSRGTALAFATCPDELATWLVSHGLSIEAVNSCGETPLQSRCAHWQGRIESLINLGADVNVSNGKGPPLRYAAGAHNTQNVKILLENGAHANALDKNSMTPLEFGLHTCSNDRIGKMAQIADLLIAAGAQKTSRMQKLLTRVATHFEFHRANFNPELVQETSGALEHLYKLLDVAPVAPREILDCTSPIIAKLAGSEDSH